jgi:hypothetical protein
LPQKHIIAAGVPGDENSLNSKPALQSICWGELLNSKVIVLMKALESEFEKSESRVPINPEDLFNLLISSSLLPDKDNEKLLIHLKNHNYSEFYNNIPRL